MLAKDERGETRRRGAAHAPGLPIFRKENGLHEVYYLQIYEDVEKKDISGIQSYMTKGIKRIGSWYDREESHNAYLAYDADFEKWLRVRREEEYWQKQWSLPMYNEYKETCNLLFLLQQLPRCNFPRQLIILGEAVNTPDWIDCIARYMKGVTCFALTKPRGFEVLREHLLDVYGLLVSWEKNLQPTSEEAALVLDYCEKANVYIWGIARESIWVDMTSMEERRHALEDRDTGIRYISLKSFWKREMLQTLDTVDKIKYNTEVKLEGKVGL